MRISRAAATSSLLFAFGAWNALAQGESTAPLRIWDIPFGTPIAELPSAEFVDPACGSNGGPPGLRLASFAEFTRCRAEVTGLTEIWFIYDDEEEYVYRALAPTMRWENPDAGVDQDRLVQRHKATQVNLQPVILSFLIDRHGLVQGYRIHTDPKTDPETRAGAASTATTFKARWGIEGWTCTDLPPAEGETPIGSGPTARFIKESCVMEVEGERIVVETRNYYKRGQSYRDPFTNRTTTNYFESLAWIEVVSLAALAQNTAPTAPEPVPLAIDAAPPATPPVAMPPPLNNDPRRDAFIAGESLQCPGCDLSGLILKRRNFEGANLAGANLANTSFHRSNLRGANFAGATLTYVNFNAAILSAAKFTNANLERALFYAADASGADFTGARLVNAHMRSARLILAKLNGADLTGVNLEEARLSNAELQNATLTDANLFKATLLRANLTGATAERSVWADASARYADFTAANLLYSDLLGADLGWANLTNANFSGTRLLSAIMLNSTQTNTNFSQALMPDNTVHP